MHDSFGLILICDGCRDPSTHKNHYTNDFVAGDSVCSVSAWLHTLTRLSSRDFELANIPEKIHPLMEARTQKRGLANLTSGFSETFAWLNLAISWSQGAVRECACGRPTCIVRRRARRS